MFRNSVVKLLGSPQAIFSSTVFQLLFKINLLQMNVMDVLVNKYHLYLSAGVRDLLSPCNNCYFLLSGIFLECELLQ